MLSHRRKRHLLHHLLICPRSSNRPITQFRASLHHRPISAPKLHHHHLVKVTNTSTSNISDSTPFFWELRDFQRNIFMFYQNSQNYQMKKTLDKIEHYYKVNTVYVYFCATQKIESAKSRILIRRIHSLTKKNKLHYNEN